MCNIWLPHVVVHKGLSKMEHGTMTALIGSHAPAMFNGHAESEQIQGVWHADC